MKINDAVAGALLLVLAAAVGWHVRGFPEMPGQKFGAALFPAVIAAGLAACGALLLVRGVRARTPAIEFAPWLSNPQLAGNFAMICIALALYVVAVDTLGFIASGFLILAMLFLKFGVKLAKALPIALIATLAIHTLFYKGLRVPLPWGFLEAVAW